MNPLTSEWVDKAEGDYLTAKRELRVRASPNYDAVCFHAQQTAEKYLKAFLQDNGRPFPRTHILADLLALCLKIDPAFLLLQSDLNMLEGYAIEFRYPGQSASNREAKEAVKATREIRSFVRTKLGIL